MFTDKIAAFLLTATHRVPEPEKKPQNTMEFLYKKHGILRNFSVSTEGKPVVPNSAQVMILSINESSELSLESCYSQLELVLPAICLQYCL